MASVSFKEELVNLEFIVGEDTVREVITGIIELADQKPDMEKILDVSAVPRYISKQIVEGGLEVAGEIACEITYIAELSHPNETQQAVYFAQGALQFANFIDLTGVQAGMEVSAEVRVTRAGYRRLGPRQLEVTLTIKEQAKVTEKRQLSMVTDVKGLPANQLEEELLSIEDIQGESTVDLLLEEKLEVPEVKPPAKQLIHTSINIFDVQGLAGEGQVSISGLGEANLVYIGDLDTGEEPIHFLGGTFDFKETIALAGVKAGQEVLARAQVKKATYKLLDGRTIALDVALEIFVKVSKAKEIMALVDLSSENVDLKKEVLRIEGLVGSKHKKEMLSQEFIIPPEKPPLERVIEAGAKIIDYSAIIEEGGVTLEGQLEAGILYVALSPPEIVQQPVHFISKQIPFESFIPIPASQVSHKVLANAFVSRMGFRVVNNRIVETDIMLEEYVKVTNLCQLEVVVDLVLISPAIISPPTFIIYLVQKGDNLERIARRFQTDPKELILHNDLDGGKPVQVGQKICIPRSIIKEKN